MSHKILLNYLVENNLELNNKTLIEIGSCRELINNNSTEEFIIFCKNNNINFISVDIDPEAQKNTEFLFTKYDFNKGKFVLEKGEDFLKQYENNIDFLYLDAFDFYHPYHTEKRKLVYKTILNCEIDDDICHQMHLDCCENIIDKVDNNTLICFDDIYNLNQRNKPWDENFDNLFGKGKTAIPFLFENGFKIISKNCRGILLQKLS